jgi:hypothetical protein
MNHTHRRSSLSEALAIALGLFLAAVAAGCAGDVADPTPDLPITLELDERDEAALDAAGAADPCECTTEACMTSWIEQEVGCDVCVVVMCDGIPVHGCNLCETAPSGSPSLTVHPKPSAI